jgi:cell shape-determining protein MreC
MTYLRRTNVTARKSRKTTGIIIAIIVVLFFVQYLFPRFYPTIFYPITSFFWSGESFATSTLGRLVQIVKSKYSLVKENERLSLEVTARDTSTLLVDSLKKENEDLKHALARTGKGDDILGIILSRPPVSPYDMFVLDVGTSDGILVGNKVYTDGDVLMGDVVETYAHESKVSLYSTPGRVVSVVIGSTNTEVQAIGRGGGNFMAKIPVELVVKVGDSIILPQIRSHVFGTVEKTIIDSADSLQTILFKAPINIHSIRFVQVDRSPNK